MEKCKSIEKFPIIEPGEYDGLWSAYYIVILFKNGKKSDKINVTQGVRGINCPCKIIIESDGQIYVE